MTEADEGPETTETAGDGAAGPRAGSQRFVRAFVVVYLIVLSAVGALDLFTATGLDARLTGALVSAAGVAGGLRGSTALFRAVAGVAAGAVLVLDGWLLSRMATGFTAQPRLVVTLAVVSSSAVAGAALLISDLREALRRRGEVAARLGAIVRPTDPQRTTLVAAAIAAASAVFAAGLALPQFWYSVRYQPSTALPVVSIDQSGPECASMTAGSR
ncbi:hypothetical protein [Streptomyces sp. NPDC001070]